MENFKRMNANSKIVTGPIFRLLEHENDKTIILQIVPLGIKQFFGYNENGEDKNELEDTFLCEYISRLEEENAPKTFPSNAMPRGDIEFENYLDTTINKDPFGGKWSGKTIRAVFEAGDVEWANRAIKEMRNEFIRSKIEYIMERGGYGKIRN